MDVLYPLKIGYNHSPCIGQDIRYNHYALLLQYLICFHCSRAVGSFYNHLCLDPCCVFPGNLVLQRSRNQHVTAAGNDLIIGYVLYII